MPQDLSPVMAGQSVLVLEDQVLIALDMEDMLLGLGAGSCWMVSDAAGAMALLDKKLPDLALLDFNLGDETAERVADKLLELAVPFLFVTGYGDSLVIPDRFRGIPIASKPVTKASLVTKIAAAQARSRS